MEKLLPGVYLAKKKDQTVYYRSSITYRNKHISLGSFPTMLVAHTAYKEADTVLYDSNLTISDYNEQQHVLSFDKWVILHNFRDNLLYLGTPIYIRPKFFYYYLSSERILKFDTDDLFYYSSRKILQRGGHLFVSDYGMQVNILNRYGIKNYGVVGRDYRFINNDETDFRYENIEIINRYTGVFQKKTNDTITYKVKIHVKSNYVVGTYSTEEEAAIAYNKAVDILTSKGVSKNYSMNFLENISPSQYADIYSKIKISPTITNFISD